MADNRKSYKFLAKNSLLFLIGSFGSKIIMFFLVPLYTNALTQSEYGISDLISTSVTLCIPIFSLALDDAILRYGLKQDTNEDNLFKNIILVLCCSTGVIALLSPIINLTGIFGEWAYYFCIILILHIIRNAFSIYLKSVDKVKVFSIDSVVYSFVLCGSNVFFLLYMKLGIKGYLISLILAMAVSILFQFIMGNMLNSFLQGKIDKKLLSEMLRYSTPLITSAISWWVINSSDRYMLEIMMGPEAVGLYAVSAKIPNLLATFTSVFSSAWMISSITEYENKRDKSFYSNVFSMYIAVLSLGASVIMVFLRLFMKYYVSEEFFAAWKYVPLLLISVLFGTSICFFTPIYKAELKNYKEVKLVFTGAISNIIINAICIPFIGIQGAGIGTYCAEGIMFIMCLFGTRKIFKFDVDFLKLFLSLGILLVEAIVTVVVPDIGVFVAIGSTVIVIYIHRAFYWKVISFAKEKFTI